MILGYKKGVHTFVEYWEFGNKRKTIKASTAELIKHKYFDTIETSCATNLEQLKTRYIHRVILTGLVETKRYGYQVGYFKPSKIRGVNCTIPQSFSEGKDPRHCKKVTRKDVFNFYMFPWSNPGDYDFTIAIFGDLGLKKPGTDVSDKPSWRSPKYDELAPQAFESLIELVHRNANPKHPMLNRLKHPIHKSHLDKKSSGFKMQSVQLILHIGDIAYNLHTWRSEGKKQNCKFYNLGDRFMSIMENVAAYVPYLHKDGIPLTDPNNPKIYKLQYGLEELYNRYHVDLVLSGHEHAFEMFPPIQLNKEMNKVVPHKYWWNATRYVNEDNNTTVQHDFMAFRDPVAPAYVVVGRPGNTEEMEQLSYIPYLEPIKQYTDFSMTLLHYPGKVAKKSLITVRQVDVLQGNVPMEFALEKTFSSFNIKEICNSMEGTIQNKYQLERNHLISDRKRHEKFSKDTIEFSIHNYANLEDKEPELFYPTLSKNEDMDKEKDFLNKEISITAGENSKIRALLYSYNLKREYPWDAHLDEMYKIAIKGVCASNYQQILKNQTDWENKQDWKNQQAFRQFTEKFLRDPSKIFGKPQEQKISNDKKTKTTNKENLQPNVNPLQTKIQTTMNPFQNPFVKNMFGTNKENVQPNFAAQNGPQNVFHFQAGADGNVKKEQNYNYFKNGTKIFGTNKENIQPTFVAQKPTFKKNVQAKKSASFAENISTDIPQNLNNSSVNASSPTGGLKGILKKVNVPLPNFPQTNSLKPVRVDTDTHITAEYSPQSLDNPNSPQVTYRINTQVKRELNDLTYLIHHFYDRASYRPSCDLSKFPLFVEYIDQNEYPFLEMDPNFAENFILNDKADCVFIHYYKYKPTNGANDGTLLDAIFSSKGLKFSGDEIKKRVSISEDGRKQIYDAVPLRVVLQTLKEVSAEGDKFFEKNQELLYFYMD
uniref:Acid phosphatase n=1 Tax=Meloidogyne javanica TaxID=6303 RepID=A0A915LL10_MELJA